MKKKDLEEQEDLIHKNEATKTRGEIEMTCPYCHEPFKPILYAEKDSYTEAFYGLEDEKGVYFGFHEERPDHDQTSVALDFAYCPMCGRKINDNPQNKVLKWNGLK